MKKKMAMALLATMLLSMTACGADKADSDKENQSSSVMQSSEAVSSEESTEESKAEDLAGAETEDSAAADNGANAGEAEAAEGAVAILTNVWAAYEEENKFSGCGGDSANPSEEGPGAFDVTKAEELDSMLGFPADKAELIDDAASLMHMMNANTFTGGVYHVTDAANVQTVADALKENIMNRQWMCGFPETLIVLSVDGEYVVSAFGNGEQITVFQTKLTEVYPNTELLYEESLW